MDTTAGADRARWDLDVIAVEIGSAAYRLRDIVTAVVISGAWLRFEASVAAGLGAESRDARAAEVDVADAAERHRRDRRLLSAADLRRWLDDRGLTVEQWLAVVRRHAAAGHEDTTTDSAAVAAVLRDETLVDGILDRTVDDLGLQAAAAAAGFAGPVDPAAALAALRECAVWTLAEPAQWQDSAERMSALAAAYAARQAAWSADELRPVVRDHALEWVRLAWNDAVFATEDQAREAILCVAVDGESLVSVSAKAGVTVETVEKIASDIDAVRASALMTAQPGEPAGPLDTSSGWCVVQLTGRLAAGDDPAATDRARTTLTETWLRSRAAGTVVRRVAL